jgi:polysaccharide pyruvyl transferase WcaK-like protein
MIGARPLRIGLFGQFGIGNLGNEGSLEALLRFLRARAPDAELVAICTDPDFVARTYGIDAARLQVQAPKGGAARMLNRALLNMPSRLANIAYTFKQVGKLDILLIPGTGILDDFGESPFGAPYEIWRWCQAAKLNGVKIGFVSIGAGPIVHPLSRVLMKAAARAARYRSYRDLPSKAFVNSIAMHTPQDPVFPDLAFGLPAPPQTPRTEGALTIAVGVMAYYGWSGAPDAGEGVYQTYIAKLSAYVVWSLEQGHRVKFVIGKDKDVDAVADVRPRVLAQVPQLEHLIAPFEPAADLHDVMRQMEAADIAVVTRFHNLVSALHVGRACISLGYARKNHALLEEMGLGGFSQEVESFDLETLKTHTNQLIATRAEHEARIRRKVADYEIQLKNQERLLAEEFLRGASVRVAGPTGIEPQALTRPVAH